MKIQYRAPRNQTELDDSIQCSVSAFDQPEHTFANIVKHDPWFDLTNTRACFVDGKVVSVVQIFRRLMRIGGCVVQMAASVTSARAPNTAAPVTHRMCFGIAFSICVRRATISQFSLRASNHITLM